LLPFPITPSAFRHCCVFLLVAACLAGQSLLAQEEPAKAPARVEVRIEGLSDAMLDSASRAVELRALATRRNASDALILRLHERAPEQISRALEAFGYYQVQVSSELEQVDGIHRARYVVTLGEPTRVHQLLVDTGGVDAENRRVGRVVRAFRPRLEEVLHHPTYEASKTRVFQTLLSEGYLEAEIERARVEVVRANNSADIQLVFNPGLRYAFGELNFIGSQVDTASLARLAPFAAGEEYRLAQLLTLQRRLTDTGYFSVVDVAPDVDALADGRVPIEVRLEPRARTEYRGGLYYGTDSGAGVRGSIERRWLNLRGDQARAELEYSQNTKLAALVYTIPMDRPGRPRLQFRSSWSDRVTDSSESRQVLLSAAYIGTWRDWNQNLSINLVDGDFEVGEEPGSSTLLYPEWQISRSSLRPGGDPARGQSLALTLRAGAESVLSDTDFVQLMAQWRQVRPIGKRGDRLILRGDLGATYVDDFDQLPPELRFFAGGDRSLRGFAFQELGPVNDLGEVRGGPYLALASAEYERRINETWAVAGFVDVGNAFDSGQFDAVVSVGSGLRWRGPVGLVRLDLGVGVSEDDVPLRLHLIIGGDL
jgi:translocation and assembly module TamA